ncbi:MAG TPA: hypothetical protein VGS22_29495 [Thermoanaerobaculia bacterium]|nr:hypothetical protein [Thermoanaerobaculia bacterium]
MIPHLAKPLEILIGIWEVALVSIILWRVVRAIRKSRTAGPETKAQDAYFRIRAAARTTLPFRAVADAIGYEIAITAYALGADRKITLPGRAFSYHRKNGYGAIVSGLMIAMLAETGGVHILLLHFHHPRIALLLTVLGLYGALWFFGDYQAARRRPIRIEADHLAIRTGLRWNLDVPFEMIAKIERADPLRPFQKGPGAIRATLFGAPLFVLHLKEPLVADGPYGRRSRVERVGFTVDEDAEFLAALPVGAL